MYWLGFYFNRFTLERYACLWGTWKHTIKILYIKQTTHIYTSEMYEDTLHKKAAALIFSGTPDLHQLLSRARFLIQLVWNGFQAGSFLTSLRLLLPLGTNILKTTPLMRKVIFQSYRLGRPTSVWALGSAAELAWLFPIRRVSVWTPLWSSLSSHLWVELRTFLPRRKRDWVQQASRCVQESSLSFLF